MAVKVYLLLVNQERYFFYSDDSEAEESSEGGQDARAGFVARLMERWRQLQTSVRTSKAGMARWIRRSWEWLHKRARPDETMLARFRSSRRIDLHHPANRSRNEVAEIWHRYLTERARQHTIYFGYNVIIAPFAVALLWPLPGPNVIGFWFAYRTVHHWFVLKGIRFVRSGRIPTEYHGDSALDLPIDQDENGQARHGGIDGRGDKLDDYLKALRSISDSRERRPPLKRLVLPNSLSLARIGLALGFPWVPLGWRGGVVVAAGLSDLFDGWLSRALGGVSTLGQILDPVADKLFVGIVLITLLVEGRLTILEAVFLGFRDLAVLGGSAWFVLRHGWRSLRQMPPSWLGKVATAGQLGFLLLLTLGMNQETPPVRVVEVAASGFSLAAGVSYLLRRSSTTDDHETSELQHP